VQADGFMVRGLFRRGDAQRFSDAELRDLVAKFLNDHGVDIDPPDNPGTLEAFCFTACRKRVEAFHDDRCGCGETGPMNMPCGHIGDYDDLCPSWSPVDGCLCAEYLGHVPHPAVLPLA
jgi:hypothetical protein